MEENIVIFKINDFFSQLIEFVEYCIYMHKKIYQLMNHRIQHDEVILFNILDKLQYNVLLERSAACAHFLSNQGRR